MRPLAAMILGCFVLLPSTAAADLAFPYKASVISDDVFVRSGPGQNYYATDKLKHGQEVEVYRHDPGGWCAIRPVDGSFTWVSSHFLKPTKNHLAVVTEDGVSARVGSRFGSTRDVIQVRLHKGEVVEVLESPRGDQWCKIAPPAGEFRWVAGKYLESDQPRDGLRRRDDGRESHGDRLLERSARERSYSAKEFQAELERLDLELSVMLIEDPKAWSFDSLRDRANQLLDESETAVERGRARLLANKIARFDDIRQRQEEVLAMRRHIDHDSRMYARLRPRDDDDGERGEAKMEIDGNYDGVGQLTEVTPAKFGAPRYALVDRSGDVRCYVTPAPGVNLQRYVGQKVGVTGNRAFILEEHASHIMARHITPLEGAMLR